MAKGVPRIKLEIDIMMLESHTRVNINILWAPVHVLYCVYMYKPITYM